MKRISLTVAALLWVTAAVLAQPMQFGSVAGTVSLPDGNPAIHAMVHLDGVNGGGRPHHPHFGTMTDSLGAFGFPQVPVGAYFVWAGMPMRGFDAIMIEVLEDQTTNVNLVLQGPDSGGHHRPPDSLTTIEVTGTALVVAPDSLNHPAEYFIDVNGDGEADYRLCFGPPWYNPPSGAVRPNDGDEITIVGGLLGYSQPPMIVVYEINGLLWREPGRGHGGHGGGDHGREGCNPDSVVRVELEGTVYWLRCEGFHHDIHCYGLSVDEDQMPEFMLDFGGPDYDPGNGAQRPENGDAVTIVGGQIYCPHAPVPIVIVYEINGMFWREPGDTLGLGPVDAGVVDPVRIGEPSSYLMARNYPNPFNPVTTIMYSIPTAGRVTLSVYDITGREVAKLVNGYAKPGEYAVSWDGSAQASGIYFYRVSVDNRMFTGRMVLMK